MKLIYSIVIAQYNHIFYMHHCYFYCNEITVVSIDDESIVFYIFFTNMPQLENAGLCGAIYVH